MRLSTAVTLALTVLLATSVLGAVAAAPSVATSTAPDRPPSELSLHDPAIQQSQTAPVSSTASATGNQSPLAAADPAQVIRITVTETGDAEWTIESRFLLTDDEDVETFNAYANAVTAGERDVEFDRRQLFEREATNAAQSTGRSMSIENMNWDEPRTEPIDTLEGESEDDVQVGVISYSFTWTNFATTDGDRIYFGDAFKTPDGTWFSTLSEEQRLVIQSPANYNFEEFTAPPTTQTNGAFVWEGPYEFGEGDLDIVFVRVAGPDITSDWWPATGIVLLVITAATAIAFVVLWRRSDDGTVLPLDRLPSTGSEAPTTDASDSDTGSDPAASPDHDPMVDADDAELTFEEPDTVDPELLSDEERVHRLLDRNGGRMKQASIVKETGWSNAKVSQLLSKMDDDGDIEKLRIGRENLITLPEVDPTEID